ncbi:GGDEF domain-containing protein [Novosphingobium album (ex Liu et al. 2023)]|uniref:diguanylate cyclase n=1 Tax=Novosphingobium album (ex Liu et al. 2023) TaxID=3031130 RepID=A0ABT5WMT2_9SPHN|nr:GGDEF domain-containing protein [Novosphingobium album (ex Liu et al. 2023)]MDE8651194.1 diguanylate cyclase [Novosphingobium album (ex Liu et al. 2023)]
MAVWGAVWSQLHLFFLPGMAGVVSAQLCTGLSCLAVTLATLSAITALDRDHLPRRLGPATLVLGGVIGVLGVPLAFMRAGPIMALADVLGVLILVDLLAVAVCLGCAWRRGSAEARTFAVAWSLPMAALAVAQFLDVDMLFWGGGSQTLVLLAAAWQTLWLSFAASRTHARLRVERDRARRAEAQAHELARRDPLTGLRNRRGFIDVVTPMLEAARANASPIALLIVDVDWFKRINDAHGHEAGDMVLATIARRIGRWEGALCTVARLGGEEFALMIGGLEGFALARFADSVRQEVAACDHHAAIGGGKVTVSIGVAEAAKGADFRHLYRLADEALYTAKHRGRDQVVLRSLDDASEHAYRFAVGA